MKSVGTAEGYKLGRESVAFIVSGVLFAIDTPRKVFQPKTTA